jgi:hypothetical protein
MIEAPFKLSINEVIVGCSRLYYNGITPIIERAGTEDKSCWYIIKILISGR